MEIILLSELFFLRLFPTELLLLRFIIFVLLVLVTSWQSGL